MAEACDLKAASRRSGGFKIFVVLMMMSARSALRSALFRPRFLARAAPLAATWLDRSPGRWLSTAPGPGRPITPIARLGTDDARMSSVVVNAGLVYVSGQVPDAGTTGVDAQTRNVLAKIDGLLRQAGTSKSSLLTASIWLKDIGGDFDAMNREWCAWLDPENKPVRATVQAAMARPEILVEVQVTAVLETQLRFGIGERVLCNMGETGGWTPGTVIALNYREDGWPSGKTAPYQVKLDGDTERQIYAPEDHDGIIRRAP